MSSSLFKLLQFTRIPLVRYSVASKRRNKAEVQLLQDFPNVGKRGQVLKVSHSLMRNKLHRFNGACYILPGEGPRIPVYVKPKKSVLPQVRKDTEQDHQLRLQKQLEQKALKQNALKQNALKEKKSKNNDIKIEGLLFELPADKPRTANVEASRGYSFYELSMNLGNLYFNVKHKDDELSSKITKTQIKDEIKQLINIDVPESDIILKSGKNVIESITKNGVYHLQIEATENEFIKKSIYVNAS